MRFPKYSKTVALAAAAALLASSAILARPSIAQETADGSDPGAATLNSAAPGPVYVSPSRLPGSYLGAWFDWPGGPAAAGSGSQPAFRNISSKFGAQGLYGLNLGVGYSFPLRQRGTLGLYGTLNFGSLASDAPGSPPRLFGYSRTKPFRTRLGGRYSHAFSPALRGYLGFAWDYGFGGISDISRTPRIPLYGPSNASAYAELGLNVMYIGDVSFDISTFGLSSGDSGDSAGGMSMVFSF
jgi:hypothetical protein